MRSITKISTLAVTAALAVPVATPVPAGAATTAHYEGTVVSVDRSARTFSLRDAQRGTIRIRVTSGTTFQRVGGFAGLKAGMTRIEATVRRASGSWTATHVERSGGGGSHGGGGGRSGGGHDDGPGHT